MKTIPYHFLFDEDRLLFTFESLGEEKKSLKMISYDPYKGQSDIFNLFLGEIIEDGSVCDVIVSNNGDMEKIFSTVIQSMFLFLNTDHL